jgi:hypothetical protein
MDVSGALLTATVMAGREPRQCLLGVAEGAAGGQGLLHQLPDLPGLGLIARKGPAARSFRGIVIGKGQPDDRAQPFLPA